MTNASKKDTGAAKNGGTCFARNLALWAGCAFLWCVVDRLTKAYFDSNFHVGQIAVPDILGLAQLNLVHNNGVAWGAFAGNIPIIAIATSLPMPLRVRSPFPPAPHLRCRLACLPMCRKTTSYSRAQFAKTWRSPPLM